MRKSIPALLASVLAIAAATTATVPAQASSHMDAPLVTLDPAANLSDVYAFISKRPDGGKALTVALSTYPFQEPGIGPNNYSFDPGVRYELAVSLDGDIAAGKPDIVYRFVFKKTYANDGTTLQTYLGKLDPAGKGKFSANQNMRLTYAVLKTDKRTGVSEVVGRGIVPPNNQGRVTPAYNIGDDGDKPAKPGVTSTGALDPFTRQAIGTGIRGYRFFAGQRDDAFYADVQSVFDLEFSFGKDRNTPSKPFDSQAGFNVHTAVLEIPLEELGGAKTAGVYASTWRRDENGYTRVGRLGNPLFNEVFVAVKDKDTYNQVGPSRDRKLFASYAKNPEVSALLGTTPLVPGLLEQIYIPDMIKVDLTTPPARLAGKAGFNRLSVFGGDTLKTADGRVVAGGWPNGRRFGDDVIDIGLIALGAAGTGPDFSTVDIDRVTANDITYNTVLPYAATPQNGRARTHD